MGLLAIGWHAFGLAVDLRALGTFTFYMFLSFALCSILSIRERGPFWKSRPSPLLAVALAADGTAGFVMAAWGVPGLPPIGPVPALVVLGYAVVFGLLVNDVVKTSLIRSLFGSASERGGSP